MEIDVIEGGTLFWYLNLIFNPPLIFRQKADFPLYGRI